MAWRFERYTGQLFSPSGNLFGIGYSGRDSGMNTPQYENVHDVGPIPKGVWDIGEFFDDPGGKGPCVAHLTPEPGFETFGRDGFMIHGDNSERNHTASEGCIILGPQQRLAISCSADKKLVVV